MDRKKATVAAAAVGALAGAVGLTVLAMPSGAGAAPVLPPVNPEQLVQSVLSQNEIPALGGTVEGKANLGLPAIPNMPIDLSGVSAKIWSDGTGKARVSTSQTGGEKIMVNDGTTAWTWDSSTKVATKHTFDKAQAPKERPAELNDPASAAKQIIDVVRPHSSISVDGTASVAGRDAYELVLAPAPTERTLLREVRVAVDAEKRIPLRVVVLANGSSEPVAQIGFTKLDIGAQDPKMFTFTPPAGSKVEESTAKFKDAEKRHEEFEKNRKPGEAPKLPESDQFKVVGEGWDTTVAGRLPKLDQLPKDENGKSPQNPMDLIKQFGAKVEGPWGKGYLITTKVGTGLLTEDGRFAAGAVPSQVLIEAIGTVK
ncbi:sigma-E factor regulatory protein RseB domain-containing protein [Allokutzneria sp. NRRL B-24872]|uniref:LolA family protein n=1 Tax=Allokutzneria sp. NRRL B-24872 TaxID=1137961 RepID=UPI000A3793DA|nr:sigma-E factor regulatory protein RseB domain-containing protein [Allokutzneria sp. NRRL B-24872]